MSDTPVIYENPKHPLPEWARWMAYEDCAVAPICFENKPFAISDDGKHWDSEGRYLEYMIGYAFPDPWQDSLRRLVRLTDPAYYVPENPHTDDEGFLPHDGGEMPEWARIRPVIVRLRSGSTWGPQWGHGLRWQHDLGGSYEATRHEVVAYKIVGEQEEGDSCCDQVRDTCKRAEKAEREASMLRGILDKYQQGGEGWSETCERYIRDAHAWRDRAVAAEAALEEIASGKAPDHVENPSDGGEPPRYGWAVDRARRALTRP